MEDHNDTKELDRRGFLKCMAWVGTGAAWMMTGGVLKGMPIEQAARGMMGMGGAGGLRFAQISDSHIGFNRKRTLMSRERSAWRSRKSRLRRNRRHSSCTPAT